MDSINHRKNIEFAKFQINLGQNLISELGIRTFRFYLLN